MFLGAKILWRRLGRSLGSRFRRQSAKSPGTQEQITATLLDKVQKFEAIWEPWALYIKLPLYLGHITL